MKSTVGRPRALTDEMVARVLAWHEAWCEARVRLKTVDEIALELHVSVKTVRRAIERRGQYKQPSPEQRDSAVTARRQLLKHLENQQVRRSG